MTTVDEIYQVALRLTEEERELLAQKIIASLPGENDTDADEAFRQELDQRMANYRSGQEPARPWMEVCQDMLKELKHDD